MGKPKNVPGDVFNYGLFRVDISNSCKQAGVSLEDISEKKLLRSRRYLSNSLSSNSLPLNIIIALCDCFDLSVKTYEKNREPRRVAPEVREEIPVVTESKPIVFNVAFGGKQYTVETKVFGDAKTVLSSVSMDGKVISTGRSTFHDNGVSNIINSISYAIHSVGRNTAYALDEL